MLILNSTLDITSNGVQFAEIREGLLVPSEICLRWCCRVNLPLTTVELEPVSNKARTYLFPIFTTMKLLFTID